MHIWTFLWLVRLKHYELQIPFSDEVKCVGVLLGNKVICWTEKIKCHSMAIKMLLGLQS